MINPSPSFIVPSLFLLLLMILGAPDSSLALPQAEPRRNRQDQQDRDGVRPPVVYLMVAGSRPGVVAGIVMAPPPAFGLRPDLVQAFHAAASLKRMRVDVTIYLDRANYILAVDESRPAWSPHHRWTLRCRIGSYLAARQRPAPSECALRRAWNNRSRVVLAGRNRPAAMTVSARKAEANAEERYAGRTIGYSLDIWRLRRIHNDASDGASISIVACWDRDYFTRVCRQNPHAIA